jgi:hypothetical protein
MNFEDEDYRRLYVRRTVTSKRLGWEGRAVRNEMLTEFDRAGIWEFTEDAAEDIAELVGLPLEVVRIGLARLLAGREPVWAMGDGRIVWPNYVEAQTCARSDRLRQQESRDRRRADAIAKTAKLPSAVTERHAPSQVSQLVTPPYPSSADPSSTELSRAEDPDPPSPVAGSVIVAEPDRGESPVWRDLKGFVPPPELIAEAAIQGIPRKVFDDRYADLASGPIGGKRGTFDRADYVRRQFPKWRTWGEQEQAAALRPKGAPRKTEAEITTTQAASAFRTSTEHEKFCAEKNLDLSFAVKLYRASPEHERVGFAESERRFLARLKCWAATGTFHPDGPLPKPKKPPAQATGGKEAA